VLAETSRDVFFKLQLLNSSDMKLKSLKDILEIHVM